MTDQSFGNKLGKGQYTAKANKLTQKQGNQLSKPTTKVYTLEAGEVKAMRLVIQADEVELKTVSHPLNPRNPNALNERSLSKTLESIRDKGITDDCLGIWDSADTETRKIQIIKGSSRRWCAIEANRDYPVWVLPHDSASNDDIRQLISSDELQRPHSFRERGEAYINELTEKGHDHLSMKNNDMADLLGVGRETFRKCMVAYNVNNRLLELFPDYEGVKQGVYATLSKIEKAIDKKDGASISSIVSSVQSQLPSFDSMPTLDAQDLVLSLLEDSVYGNDLEKNTGWKVEQLKDFGKKSKQQVKKSTSPDNRSVKYELSRLPQELMSEIDEFIRNKVDSI